MGNVLCKRVPEVEGNSGSSEATTIVDASYIARLADEVAVVMNTRRIEAAAAREARLRRLAPTRAQASTSAPTPEPFRAFGTYEDEEDGDVQ
jgi:hypothetical protein